MRGNRQTLALILVYLDLLTLNRDLLLKAHYIRMTGQPLGKGRLEGFGEGREVDTQGK